MRFAKNGWVHRMIRSANDRATSAEQSARLYKFALEDANEGVVIADANGVILTANEAYASYIDQTVAGMSGRHVTEVIDNTRLHIVAKTGKAEFGDLQLIKGHWMIASRIPIVTDGEVVAVVGKIMFDDIDRLFAMNEKYKEIKKHLHSNPRDKKTAATGAKYGFSHIVGASHALSDIKLLAARAAKSGSTILISGESGTGKELFAHAIHRESSRFYGPFVAVNCAAIPEQLFESELFGYKEGSFTGASRQGKKGKFALADKGTLFLDEVGELPLTMQAKLLRVLQEREIEPVGALKPEPVDVRIIAATNRDLSKLAEEGAFRRDLFYRLHVIVLQVPPLRERREDVPELARELLAQLQSETGMSAAGITPEAAALLQAYDWPGNVRELRNVLERALFIRKGDAIAAGDLPPEVLGVRAAAANGLALAREERVLSGSWKSSMEAHERQLLREALAESLGDKLQAAKRLGMSKSAFYEKLEKYGASMKEE
ncbi:sigma-54 interaction domain-containing protein [Paenibacillus sp. MBLB4367]|uniref:sigma-54 interaction domain-containing protein n=1 Tax=Paenibacillus sp. MBLB4367 TaxID=3384767 RepID=UPI0039082A68